MWVSGDQVAATLMAFGEFLHMFEVIVENPSFGQQFFGLGEEVDLNLNLNFEIPQIKATIDLSFVQLRPGSDFEGQDRWDAMFAQGADHNLWWCMHGC